MNKIIVISAFLSLALGCAGGLKLDANSLFTKKPDDASSGSSEAATKSPDGANADGASADGADPAEAEAAVDPAAQRRAHYQSKIDQVDALLQMLPQCCQGEDFLLQMTAKYPSEGFVKDYKEFLFNKLARSGESGTPEWQAVEAKFKELQEALTAVIRLPKDAYKGKDAKQVRSIFKDHAAESIKKPVLDVVLLKEDWSRTSGSTSRGGSLINFDEGFLRAFVLVEGDSGKGEVWDITPRKDFLNGGKVAIDVYVPTKIADIMLPAAGAKK